MIVIDETGDEPIIKEAGWWDDVKGWWNKKDKPNPPVNEPQEPSSDIGEPPDDVLLEDDEVDDSQTAEESIEPAGDLPIDETEGFDSVGSEYETVESKPSKWEKENNTLNTPSKIWVAMGNNDEHAPVPLRIVYTTIKGNTTERTVRPDHVHWTKGHAIMVAWCEMRNDWRAFIVDRISKSKLIG